MATFVATHPISKPIESSRSKQDRRFGLPLVSVLTLFAFAIHGYHPYADDGGLYVAGIKRLLNPNLYPHRSEFVFEPMRFSLFAPAVAGIVRLIPFPQEKVLPFALLGLHLATLWTTLFAAWMLASRCWQQREIQAGALTLLACWLGLPVAGTALMLMDPYLTARSFSTPCMVLALVGVLDWTDSSLTAPNRRKGFALMIGSILFAIAMHPLMAAYALGASMLLLCLRSPRQIARTWGAITVGAIGLLLVWLLQRTAPPESSAYLQIALTRTYWFIAQWRWYEIFGLVAPLLILTGYVVAFSRQNPSGVAPNHPTMALAQMAIASGSLAVLVALVFARADSLTHLVARMQPLRVFQIVYLVILLFLGAKLAEAVLKRSLWRWGVAIIAMSTPLLAGAYAPYPNSRHIEAPWLATQNPWVHAFEWVRRNTPADALFALDADYINAQEEDAQCFRAIAERSALADYSKDGGEASIAPSLTQEWARDQATQAGLSAPATSDAQRITALSPPGVSWMVLSAKAVTSLSCPYRNEVVAVCRLP